MKTIGLLGGMSWESTALYYKIINEQVKLRLGALHSAKIILYSVNFHEIEQLQMAGEWEKAGRILADAARALERAGADFIVLCTNTMHKVAGHITDAVNIPLLHIADATAARIYTAGLRKVGLLATRFTMEQDFYKARLQRCGIDVIVPADQERQAVHDIIYNELCQGIIREKSRDLYRQVIASLTDAGAEAIILGCTEITLQVRQEDASVPLFDTTFIHAEDAVNASLR
ncbi:aspartate/glutamate racemase family protein [Pantoea sp.]|uniref:aspartate/glutamate racemase family protein n=1 Tax=Pantoea sp. TaxID=69393 RepID=UPI002899EC1A|nr:aspartate/glutamate racemase family protein [Pantoea sp.]